VGQKAIKKLEQTTQELENAETELKKKVKEGKPKGRVALSLVLLLGCSCAGVILVIAALQLPQTGM